MSIVPSGNRRQMESQSYLYNYHDSATDSIIDRMLQKAAELDINPQDATSQLATPAIPERKPVREPGTATVNENAQLNVDDVMNDSNSLPQQQEAPSNGMGAGRFENKVNQVAQDVLGSLDLDPSQWTTNTNVSSGAGGEVAAISINLKRSKPEAGPVIQKP